MNMEIATLIYTVHTGFGLVIPTQYPLLNPMIIVFTQKGKQDGKRYKGALRQPERPQQEAVGDGKANDKLHRLSGR